MTDQHVKDSDTPVRTESVGQRSSSGGLLIIAILRIM